MNAVYLDISYCVRLSCVLLYNVTQKRLSFVFVLRATSMQCIAIYRIACDYILYFHIFSYSILCATSIWHIAIYYIMCAYNLYSYTVYCVPHLYCYILCATSIWHIAIYCIMCAYNVYYYTVYCALLHSVLCATSIQCIAMYCIACNDI